MAPHNLFVEELRRRNYAESTIDIHTVEDAAPSTRSVIKET
jgi:hypothetical protein